MRFNIKQVLTLGWKEYIIIIILLILTVAPLFGYLDVLSLRVWDESRNANNAYEMLKNGDIIVTYFDGKPDLWNTKPPLLIWFQALFMKLFGINIYSVRLPSAIVGLFTCIMVYLFSRKIFKSEIMGFIGVIILLSSKGYMIYHGIRFGEFDGFLTLFAFCYVLFYFLYLETNKNKYLYAFFISLILAVLSKGVAGLLLTPALFLYTILDKKLVLVLKNKTFYIGTLFFGIIILGYYFLRNYLSPGYLEAVYMNELGGRFNNSLESNKRDLWFYFENLKRFRFKEYLYFLPLGIIVGLIDKKKEVRRLTILLSLTCITFLAIITIAQTKLEWYDMPLYPFFSILVGIVIFKVFQIISKIQFLKAFKLNVILSYIFLIAILYNPYTSVFKELSKKEDKRFLSSAEIAYFLRDKLDYPNNNEEEDLVFVYDGYNTSHLRFYKHALAERDIIIDIKKKEDIKTGDTIYANQIAVYDFINKNYQVKILKEFSNELYPNLKKIIVSNKIENSKKKISIQ
jgi:4-amino-4-deoxy-L-arabinose transferase-like glycosyltransferase